jgi:hypothetical protein
MKKKTMSRIKELEDELEKEKRKELKQTFFNLDTGKEEEVVSSSSVVDNDLINKKKEAINIIIEYLKIANKRGGFELMEARDIYRSILNTNKLAFSPEELEIQAASAAHLMKALTIAHKRGCFELEESYKIGNACELFTK